MATYNKLTPGVRIKVIENIGKTPFYTVGEIGAVVSPCKGEGEQCRVEFDNGDVLWLFDEELEVIKE